MWDDFFESGGWGMYPTAIFGFLLLAACVLLLLRPERRFVPLVLSLSVVTVCSGVLSSSVGFIMSFQYLRAVEPAKQLQIAAMGCAESLHNMVLAMVLVVVAGLLASAAALRASRRAAVDRSTAGAA